MNSDQTELVYFLYLYKALDASEKLLIYDLSMTYYLLGNHHNSKQTASSFFFNFFKSNAKLRDVKSKFNKDSNKMKLSQSFLTFGNAVLTNAECVKTPGFPELRLAYNDLL